MPIIEAPQSITVIGAEEIETLKAQSLQDALGYLAGANRAEGQDRTTDSFFLRAFRTGSLYTINPYDGRQEPYGLERIEYLKGASSVLYGALPPGGVINTVSKRPTTEPLREVNAEFGSFGTPFRPVSGTQYEAGVRYQPKGSDTLLSMALYQLTLQNNPVTDPQSPANQIQAGEVRSRGIELGAGMRYVGESRGLAHGSAVSVPSFVLFDAMVSYTTGPWRLALNLANLADRTYVANCTYGCFYGEPRRAIGSVAYRW